MKTDYQKFIAKRARLRTIIDLVIIIAIVILVCCSFGQFVKPGTP